MNKAIDNGKNDNSFMEDYNDDEDDYDDDVNDDGEE